MCNWEDLLGHLTPHQAASSVRFEPYYQRQLLLPVLLSAGTGAHPAACDQAVSLATWLVSGGDVGFIATSTKLC